MALNMSGLEKNSASSCCTDWIVDVIAGNTDWMGEFNFGANTRKGLVLTSVTKKLKRTAKLYGTFFRATCD